MDDEIMTGDDLTSLCEAAFGKSWKPQLARELGVYISTVNRWVSGFTPISRKNAMAVRAACQRRIEQQNQRHIERQDPAVIV